MMRFQPDLVGTVTLTSGEVAFEVDGINLSTQFVLPGDLILLPTVGAVLTIQDVTDATTGELTDPCPAVLAGTDLPCRIRFQSDLSRNAASARDLLMRLSGGNLDALAALDGTGGNLLPRFTGAGTMDVTALSAAIAPLLGQSSRVAAADWLAAKGSNIASGSTTNLATATGVYVQVTGTGTINSFGNAPDGTVRIVQFSGGITIVHSSSIVLPGNANIVTALTDFGVFVADGASTWRCVNFERRNGLPLVGAVTSGANANGEWYRMGNLQICTKRLSGLGPITTGMDALFRSAAVVNGGAMAATFSSVPIVIAELGKESSTLSGWTTKTTPVATASAFGGCYPTMSRSWPDTDFYVDFTAIGSIA